MKCLLLLLFLHYPDLQSCQHPPRMWFLHFGREWHKVTKSPMDRLVSPGTGKGRGKGEKCHRFPLESGGSILSEWVHWAQGPRFGLHRAPGLPRLWEAGIPSPCSCLAGLRSKLPFEEVPGQLTTLCKSEDPGPDNLARDLTNQSQQASPSPFNC